MQLMVVGLFCLGGKTKLTPHQYTFGITELGILVASASMGKVFFLGTLEVY